jgi:hypothetical protein
MRELDEIAERAVARIDRVVVGDVVAVVPAGRFLERHQPDRGDAEPVEVVEPAHQPLEVADAVAVGVHEAADGEAIKDRVLVPEVVDHDGYAENGRWASSPQQTRASPVPRIAVAGLGPAAATRRRTTHRPLAELDIRS